MSSTRYLVLIETAGNQHFIFATNKLRENVGASEMTARAGTRFVDEAREALSPEERHATRVIVQTSGKALLWVPSRAVGETIIRTVTTLAIKEAPGLTVRGAISEDFDLNVPGTIHARVKKVHERHAALAAEVPGPHERFQRLPVVEECRTSGLPAAKLAKDPDGRFIPVSAVTLAKRAAATEGWKRIRTEDVGEVEGRLLAPGPDVLDDMKLDWLAVIHADGNGFGRVFLHFHEHLPDGPTGYSNKDYADKLEAFSQGLEKGTRNAFRTALGLMARSWQRDPRHSKYLPIVPLVLGGDDLTVLCDGKYAVQLARDYLRAFEQETSGLRKCVGLISRVEGWRGAP